MKQIFTSLSTALLTAALAFGSTGAFAAETLGSNLTLGATDNSAVFWTAFSDSYEIPAGSILTYSFKNYSAGANYQNFLVVTSTTAQNAPGYSEYFVLRADNWGWGLQNAATGENGFNYTNTSVEWDNFSTEMNGADVKVSVLNNNSVIYVSVDITTSTGKTWQEDYNWAGSTISGSIYSFLTVDGAHLENLTVTRESNWSLTAEAAVKIYTADGVTTTAPNAGGVVVKAGDVRLPIGTATLSTMTSDGKVTASYDGKTATAQFEFVEGKVIAGATDFSSGYLASKTNKVKVESGKSYSLTYQVRSNGAANYNNGNVLLTNEAGTSEWLVRADNYVIAPAGVTYTGAMSSNWVWTGNAAFGNCIDGSVYTTTITNNGDGTAQVRYDCVDGGGNPHYQSFSGITVDANDLYVYFSPEASYMLVEDASSTALTPIAEDNADVQISVKGSDIIVLGADSFEVYNLLGRKVAAQNLDKGIYIVRAAGVAKRVVIK